MSFEDTSSEEVSQKLHEALQAQREAGGDFFEFMAQHTTVDIDAARHLQHRMHERKRNAGAVVGVAMGGLAVMAACLGGYGEAGVLAVAGGVYGWQGWKSRKILRAGQQG